MKILRSYNEHNKTFEELMKRADEADIPKIIKDKMKDLGQKIKEMTSTEGWQMIVKPFLEKNGNPEILFKLTPEEFAKRAPVVKAYHTLLQMIESLERAAEED